MRAFPLRLRHGHELVDHEGDCRAALTLLGGIALGVLGSDEGGGNTWHEELLEHIWQYQKLVVDMDPTGCRRLCNHLQELFTSLVES